MNSEFLVDIPMCVYNHEEFIAQAIEGIVNQKTNFKYRLLIGEDCSTDKTRSIIEKYLLEYPDKIKAYFHDKNIGVYENSKLLFRNCNSKYIALCDGDDYWTDNLKLQKQIDFLEKNPDYVLCSANAKVENLTKKPFRAIYCHFEMDISFDQAQILTDFYCPTLSMVFRNELASLPDWFHEVKSGDSFLHYILSKHGKFYYMNFVAGVYRQHIGGISNVNDKMLWFENNLYYLNLLRDYVDPESKIALKDHIYKIQLDYIRVMNEKRQYKKALRYFFELENLPMSRRKKYLKSTLILFSKTLLHK